MASPQLTLSLRVKRIQSLKKIITLFGTIVSGILCDLTNNIFDHILKADARMALFLIITLVCAEGCTPGYNATAAILGGENGGERAIQSYPVNRLLIQLDAEV